MADAVETVSSKRQPDGRWLLDRVHPGGSTSPRGRRGPAEPLEHAACPPRARLVEGRPEPCPPRLRLPMDAIALPR
jgi:hypothetical protein